MDLSRAKTILIIAFLILNSILLYQIHIKQKGDSDYSSLLLEEIREVEELLQAEGIYLNQEIPSAIPDRPFLKTEKTDYFPSEIRKEIAGNDPDLLIDVQPGKGINYTWKDEDSEARKAYDIANGYEGFLRNYLYQWRSLHFYTERLSNNNGYIMYVQYYDDYPIYGTMAVAMIDSGKIVKWHQNVLTQIEAEETTRPILAAATALRRLPSVIEERPVTIDKIELGYYSRFSEGDSWLLPPVWGVTLSTGEEFYINAFTGELEGLHEQVEE